MRLIRVSKRKRNSTKRLLQLKQYVVVMYVCRHRTNNHRRRVYHYLLLYSIMLCCEELRFVLFCFVLLCFVLLRSFAVVSCCVALRDVVLNWLG